MQKWIAFILSFYLLFTAVVPCTYIDRCEEETTQHSDSAPDKNCSNCPPFSICSKTQGFALQHFSLAPRQAVTAAPLLYSEYHFSLPANYASSLFQPPRMG